MKQDMHSSLSGDFLLDVSCIEEIMLKIQAMGLDMFWTLWSLSRKPSNVFYDDQGHFFLITAEGRFLWFDALGRQMENPRTVASLYSFHVRSGIVEYMVPEGVAHICECAFNPAASTLESVSLPDSLKLISSRSFSGCTRLSEIEIPRNVSFVADNAFLGCAGLKRILAPRDTERSFGKFRNENPDAELILF